MKSKKVLILIYLLCAVSLYGAQETQRWELDELVKSFDANEGSVTNMPITNLVSGGSQAYITTPGDQQYLVLLGESGATPATGTSIALNSEFDRIRLGNVAPDSSTSTANPFTIAFWFNSGPMNNYNGGPDTVMSTNTGQDGRWAIDMSGLTGGTLMNLNFYHAGGASTTLYDAVDANEWYHVALTRSNETSDNYKIYLNGVEEEVLTDTTAFTNSSDGVWVGRRPLGTRGFDGLFDEIRFYDDAVSSDLIWQLSHPQLFAYNPYPREYAVDVNKIVTLQWNTALDNDNNVNSSVTAHYLYISTDSNFSGVSAYTIPAGSPPNKLGSYAATLQTDKKFYWRVDESINNSLPAAPETIVGMVWSFDTVKSVIITSNPNDVLAAVDDTVGFSVSFQSSLSNNVTWYKSLDDSTSTPGDDSIAGTGQNLSISNVQVSHEGYYFCVVSNIDGSAVSDTATLGVKRLMAHWSLDNDAEGWDGSYYLDESTEDPCDHDADPNGTVTFVTGQKDEGVDMSTGWATAGTWNPSEFSGQLTVSFWLNWDGTNGTWQNFVTKRTGSWSAANALWQVCTDNDGNDLWFQSPHSNIQVADALVVGQWQHVVATFDGETGALYVNGEIANGGSFEFGDESAETTMLTLGNVVEGTLPGNGKLDDVKIYNYAISELDVASIYTTDVPGETVCITSSYASKYDFNGDCIVDLKDYAKVVAEWMNCALVPNCLP